VFFISQTAAHLIFWMKKQESDRNMHLMLQSLFNSTCTPC